MTLIPSLPKLTIFVIFGVLERNIPVKQTGEVQQLCVQSCVRVLKNTKDMEINITIALTPRMSLTKGIQNQFFPESPEEWLFLVYLPVIFFTYKYYCEINRPPCRKTDKIPWNSANKFNSLTFLNVQILIATYWRATTKLHLTTKSYHSILKFKANQQSTCKCRKSSFQQDPIWFLLNSLFKCCGRFLTNTQQQLLHNRPTKTTAH